MKTLKLFNAVIAKPSNEQPFVSEEGFIMEPNALWAKDKILSYYQKEKLNGNDLNKTFHKSWKTIKDTDRCELLIHQILHYITTYGTNFQAEMYIPDEVLNVPDVKVIFKVIKAYTKKELTEKCLVLLKSGVALKEETIVDVLSVLTDDLGYTFTGKEGIRNKEAIIMIADLYGVIPQDIMEFFRYIIYRSTGKSLLIKNPGTVELIKKSTYNPSVQFQQFGLERLAEIFNRFKPLFLAFKTKCPKIINKIAKLSKTQHKPLISNPLNFATSRLLTSADIHWLDNATPYALFKAISGCYTRMNGQDSFVYRIRNGKSWTREKETSQVNGQNFMFLLNYLKERFSLEGKKFFLPKNITFSLPTSEKMFVGNIPTGTRFYGKKMAVGVYWENAWGARDIDVHGMNLDGHVGWNSWTYSQEEGNLMYSGDITNAPHGAVEYLYAGKGLSHPTLVQINIYNGSDTCGYKIIVGKGDKMSKEYMMNPNNLFMEVKVESIQKQNTLGLFLPDGEKQSFVLLNFGSGSSRVSGKNNITEIANKALQQQWENSYSFNELIQSLGGEIVETREDSSYDFSLDTLEKDSFIKVFTGLEIEVQK
jgi:hypothetical protein